MSPVESTDPPDLKVQYPHVDGIEDWRAQQSIRLLWERVFDHEARLRGTEATTVDLITATNANEEAVQLADRKAMEALAKAQGALADVGSGGAGGSGGGGGKDDLGLGAEGCSAAGADGHLTEPFDKTVTSAGKIVCGVGHEFPALLAGTPDYATRTANRLELINRMIWHLNQAGFAAAHYGTPGTPEGSTNLLFDALSLDGLTPVRQYAYRVTTYDPGEFGVPPVPWPTDHTIDTCMVCSGQSPGLTTPPDAGTAD